VAGRKGRSGRKPGATSWWQNPPARAGHHLNVLIEMWLGGVPIPTVPDRYLMQPTERKYTVPPKIKCALAEMAIAHTWRLDNHGVAEPLVEMWMAGMQLPSRALAEISVAHILYVLYARHLTRPDAAKVLAWSRRHPPDNTSRHKKTMHI
jgi:hypothetical protein